MLNAFKILWPRLFSGKFHRVSSQCQRQINTRWVIYDVYWHFLSFELSLTFEFRPKFNSYVTNYHLNWSIFKLSCEDLHRNGLIARWLWLQQSFQCLVTKSEYFNVLHPSPLPSHIPYVRQKLFLFFPNRCGWTFPKWFRDQLPQLYDGESLIIDLISLLYKIKTCFSYYHQLLWQWTSKLNVFESTCVLERNIIWTSIYIRWSLNGSLLWSKRFILYSVLSPSRSAIIKISERQLNPTPSSNDWFSLRPSFLFTFFKLKTFFFISAQASRCPKQKQQSFSPTRLNEPFPTQKTKLFFYSFANVLSVNGTCLWRNEFVVGVKLSSFRRQKFLLVFLSVARSKVEFYSWKLRASQRQVLSPTFD